MIEHARNNTFRRVRRGRSVDSLSRLAVVSAALGLAACAAGPSPGGRAGASPGAAGEPRRIQVLFLGHESAHHNSNVYAPMLAQALAPQGIDVSYTTDPNDLEP
ncbi:MAG: hypothetical protein ACREMQ_11725, partial [Longimicrobiales bacterium]